MNIEYVFQIDALFSTNEINSWCIRVPQEIKYKSISSIQNNIVTKNIKLLKLK